MRLFVLIVWLSVSATATAESSVSPERSRRYERYAMTHAGNAARGKELFDESKVTRCLVCHRVGSRGGKIGPDLSKIGGKFDRVHLIESLLNPSAQIVQGFQTRVVLTRDGQVRSGVLVSEGDQSLVICDAEGNESTIARSEIEAIKTSDVSTMPDNLVSQLSRQQFTDLVAYLETLRTGANGKFGSGTRGPVKLPSGFQIETVVTGLSGATAMEVLPDGRILICEQEGRLRVVKNGTLLNRPMLSLDVENYWERGLIGVTVDPNFPETNWLYICYVVGKPYTHHRIGRVRVQGDVALPETLQVLLKGDDQSKLGGNVPAGHQGGALHFGTDGKLYVGIGEQTAGSPAQSLETFQGKIIRLNPDGSVPKDNPLLEKSAGKYRAIWAYGCRNPFTFAIDSTTGRMLINDVGGKYEEINPGIPGANYGWPRVDHGPVNEDAFVGPIHYYPQASISGGDFAPDSAGPDLGGRYFFADFVHGWIQSIDPTDGGQAKEFLRGLRRPVDLRFANDGSLYVLLRNAWVVDDKFQRDSGSLVRIHQSGRR